MAPIFTLCTNLDSISESSTLQLSIFFFFTSLPRPIEGRRRRRNRAIWHHLFDLANHGTTVAPNTPYPRQYIKTSQPLSQHQKPYSITLGMYICDTSRHKNYSRITYHWRPSTQLHPPEKLLLGNLDNDQSYPQIYRQIFTISDTANTANNAILATGQKPSHTRLPHSINTVSVETHTPTVTHNPALARLMCNWGNHGYLNEIVPISYRSHHVIQQTSASLTVCHGANTLRYAEGPRGTPQGLRTCARSVLSPATRLKP